MFKFKMTDNRLKRLIECCICLKEFSDPRILPCFHTFCLECIRRTGDAGGKHPGDKMTCPLCRTEFIIPREGMNGLPKNFFMQHLIEVTATLQLIEMSGIACECDICQNLNEGQEAVRPATMRCSECRQNFCDQCSRAHTLQRLSRGHQMVEIGSEVEEHIRSMAPTRNCSAHNGKPLDYYCPQCKKIVCVSCFVEGHSTHGCKDVNNVEKSFRQVIEKHALKCSIYANEILPRSKLVTKRKEDILLKLTVIENEIGRRHLELKEMVDNHTKSLIEELSLIKQNHIKDCENQIEEIERSHTILNSFHAYCTELGSKGSASDVCDCVDKLVERANELERDHEAFIGQPLETIDFSFTPTDLHVGGKTSSTNIVGRIQEKVTHMENCVVIAGLNDGRNLRKDVIEINLHRRQEMSTRQEIPTKLQKGAAAVVYCNTMYITGIGDNRDEIWKYNAASGWLKCASLIRGRSEHCAEFVDGILYICGGRLASEGAILRSVEAYNGVTNKCEIVGKLIHFVESSGNCVPFRKSLYIFGGSNKDSNALNKVQVYHTKINICTLLSKPMPRGYKLMRAALWETSVILLGCETCFIYNIETKTWQERKQFKTDVVHFGLTIENERIFVIGGGISTIDDAGKWSQRCRDDVRYVPLKSVIDDKHFEWKTYTKLAKPVQVHYYGKMLVTRKRTVIEGGIELLNLTY